MKAALTLCEDLKKKIDKEGKSELYPVECGKGEVCSNKKTVTTLNPVDQEMTFSADMTCKIKVKITGNFIVTGEIGECCPKK